MIFTISFAGFFVKPEKVEAAGIDTLVAGGLDALIILGLISYGAVFNNQEDAKAAAHKLIADQMELFGVNAMIYRCKLYWAAGSCCWKIYWDISAQQAAALKLYVNDLLNPGENISYINDVTTGGPVPTVVPGQIQPLNVSDPDMSNWIPINTLCTWEITINDGIRALYPQAYAVDQTGMQTRILQTEDGNIYVDTKASGANWVNRFKFTQAELSFMTAAWGDGTFYMCYGLKAKGGAWTNGRLSYNATASMPKLTTVFPHEGTAINIHGQEGIVDNPTYDWWSKTIEGVNHKIASVALKVSDTAATDAGVVVGGQTWVLDDEAATKAATDVAADVTDTPYTDGMIIDMPITDTIPDTITVPKTIDTPDFNNKPDFKLMLTQKFPFCLPFDFANAVNVFLSVPTAPKFEATFFEGEAYQTDVDFDFAIFKDLAAFSRWFSVIAFCFMLIFATNKLIKH